MEVVTAPKEHQYPTPKEWRDRVLAELRGRRGAQADLARKIGCAPGTLNELLHSGKHSHLVPAIHRELGWPPPALPATGSTDQHEIEAFLKKMGKTGREAFRMLSVMDPDKLRALLPLLEQLSNAAGEDN